MENRIKFAELIYGSCQKSLVTGNAGFQIRTHTEGLDSFIIEAVGRSSLFGYSIPEEKRVSISQLKENPKIVCDYPRTFNYKKIETINGEQKYVLSRTTYIGIDYGYFCNGSATRDGANYITHVLIFDSEPPKEIFKILYDNNCFGNSVFLPLDNTCSPDNAELANLLTGEPQPMPANFFETGESLPFDTLPDYMGEVIIGVLQLYISRKYHPDENKCLIIKASNEITDYIAATVRLFMPDVFVKDLTFTTNHFKSGLPADMDIVFVNEWYDGNLYEEDHICIDLLANKHTGIENNVFFDKVLDDVSKDNLTGLCKLFDYLITVELNNPLQFRFLFDVFLYVKLGKELPVSKIQTEFIEKLNSIGLPDSELKSFWDRINMNVNDGLKSGNVEQTREMIETLQRLGKKNIHITEDTKEHFKQFMLKQFDPDDDDVFSQIVNTNNMQLVAELVQKDHVQLLFDYIAGHPQNFDQYYVILDDIFTGSPKERFSEFIGLTKKAGNTSFVLANLSPLVEKYFCRNDSFAVMKEYNDMLSKIPPEIHNQLKFGKIPQKFMEIILKNPDKNMKQTIERFLDFNIQTEENEKKSFAAILAIMNDEMPEGTNKNEMVLAYKLGNKPLLENVFNEWLKEGFTADDFMSFLKQADYLEGATQFIERIVVAVWDAKTPEIRNNREDLIKIILNHAKWEKNSYNKFLKRSEHKDLVAFMKKSSGFLGKLINVFKM